MASSIIHNEIMKVVGLLVGAVHMVKSPANRKKFFLVKGEQKMDEKELKEKLKEDGLSDDEIAFIMANDNIKSILMDDKNEKKALEIIKEGIRKQLIEIENALEGDSISELTNKIVSPFEGITNFLSPSDEGGGDDDEPDDKKGDGKKGDDTSNNDDTKPDDSDDELAESVSELVEEVSGLAEDASELVG
jgi:hypothetical protein